jgi:hypothetical protein
MLRAARFDGVVAMSGWWDRQAAHLQALQLEHDASPDTIYSDERIRQAIAFTRSDLVLAVSLLSSLNRQLDSIVKLLVLLAAIAIPSALKWLF